MGSPAYRDPRSPWLQLPRWLPYLYSAEKTLYIDPTTGSFIKRLGIFLVLRDRRTGGAHS